MFRSPIQVVHDDTVTPMLENDLPPVRDGIREAAVGTVLPHCDVTMRGGLPVDQPGGRPA